MAHKKGQGSSKNGRSSNPQYLGLKKFSGEYIKIGGIIIRQKGERIKAGMNVKYGKDCTLFSTKNGQVLFTRCKRGTYKANVF